MKIKRFFLSLFLLLNVVVPVAILMPNVAHAATAENCKPESASLLGLPTWYKYLSPTFDGQECKIQFDINEDVPKVGLAIFEIILRIAGLVAVGFVIYGGFQFLLSQGEPERTKNARGTIINALIGLAIAISATAIVNLVANGIT